MNTGYTIRVEENPDAKDVAIVREGLQEYNLPYAGHFDYKELVILLRDETDSVVGGLLGCTYWGYLFIQILWIKENHRSRGKGKALLGVAEQEAVRRGCRYSHLNTHSFQALWFYEKQDYIIAGELEDFPAGYSRYLLRKVLR